MWDELRYEIFELRDDRSHKVLETRLMSEVEASRTNQALRESRQPCQWAAPGVQPARKPLLEFRPTAAFVRRAIAANALAVRM